MNNNRQITLKSHVQGTLTEGHFGLVETAIPQPGDGFACGRLHVTVDRTHERRVTQATVRILP